VWDLLRAGCSIKAQLEVCEPSMAVVADRFVATPLLAGVPTDDRFHVVAIDGNRVRLLRGERRGLDEIAPPGLSSERLRRRDLNVMRTGCTLIGWSIEPCGKRSGARRHG
jgi:hypothetical protein